MAAYYKLINNRTKHYYLGATQWPELRETGHLKEIAAGKKPGLWKRLWKEHPELRDPSLWRLVVIREYKTLERAVEKEAQALDVHVGRPLCLNARRTGLAAGTLTQTAREKVADSLKGRPLSDEHKQRVSNTLKGRPLSDKTKAKMSAVRLGKTHTVESKRKMAEARKAWHARRREERARAQGTEDAS